MKDQKIGFIGGGNMARSLIGGLLNATATPDNLAVADPDENCRRQIQESFKVATYIQNSDIATRSDVIVLAVKPQVMRNALHSIADVVKDKKLLLISIAAGVRIASIQKWLDAVVPIVRVMPNTPALVGSGASALFANEAVTETQHGLAESILRSVGVTAWVSDEALMDTVTALSGSGPAYFFYLMEALEQGAIANGLDRQTARLLTLETAFGSAKLALESHQAFTDLRHNVTSPGGTTEAAIRVLDDANVDQLFNDALDAAKARSQELAELFGEDS